MEGLVGLGLWDEIAIPYIYTIFNSQWIKWVGAQNGHIFGQGQLKEYKVDQFWVNTHKNVYQSGLA